MDSNSEAKKGKKSKKKKSDKNELKEKKKDKKVAGDGAEVKVKEKKKKEKKSKKKKRDSEVVEDSNQGKVLKRKMIQAAWSRAPADIAAKWSRFEDRDFDEPLVLQLLTDRSAARANGQYKLADEKALALRDLGISYIDESCLFFPQRLDDSAIANKKRRKSS